MTSKLNKLLTALRASEDLTRELRAAVHVELRAARKRVQTAAYMQPKGFFPQLRPLLALMLLALLSCCSRGHSDNRPLVVDPLSSPIARPTRGPLIEDPLSSPFASTMQRNNQPAPTPSPGGQPVPEPDTYLMLSVGFLALWITRRRLNTPTPTLPGD